MDIETRFNGWDGFAEFGLPDDWNLMFSYDLRGWRIGFSFKNPLGGPFQCYTLNVLCFDIHLHH